MTRQGAGAGAAFGYVTALFFVWGAVTSVNDVLIPAVKSIYALSDTEAFLTQFAFFSLTASYRCPPPHWLHGWGRRTRSSWR